MIYYGVYHTAAELADEGDVLCSVRKKYFETGAKQKNRTALNVSGEMIKASYTIENGKPLKWKKLIGSRICERVTIKNNSYFVESLDNDRKVFKRSHYDMKHNWLYSEFFLTNDRNVPDITYSPTTDNDKPAIICRQGQKTEMLYPFEIIVDKEITERLNELVGEPPLLCKTSCGTFYFCTAEEAGIREKALGRILEEPEESENADELIEPGFDINTSALLAETPSIMQEIIPGLPEEIQDISKENTDNKDDEDNADIKNDIAVNDEPDNTDNITVISKPEEKTEEPEPILEKTSDEPKNVISIIQNISKTEKEKTFPPESEITPLKTHETEPVIRDFSFTSDVSALYENSSTGEEAGFNITDGPGCAFYGQCPYESIDKLIIESGGKQYFYFGETDGDIRHGSGRTAMFDGKTAYEGSYKNDLRDGFGVYYFKSGKICYVGSWKENKREGLGTAYSSNDGSVFVGRWQDDKPVSVGASFDRDGKLVYFGKTNEGRRSGAGITYSEENDLFFVGKYLDGEFLGKGTQFDSDGNMLYAGGFSDGMRHGKGVSYYPDGSVQYNGEWEQGEYCGEGILYLNDGCVLKGSFRSGRANGKCTLTDSDGHTIYAGGFKNDLYDGFGRLYYRGGRYIEGSFNEGETSGIINEYSSEGELLYCGEWSDMERSGKGTAYSGGEKIYEGEFTGGRFEGQGKLFHGGELIYSGSFKNGCASGFGTEFREGTTVYTGMWENDLYSGCGLLFENGEPKFAGCFKEGQREGRINEIENGHIIRKCLYENDELAYMCEYNESGSILYYGNVKDSQRSGMGCSFDDSGEKVFEGIFKNGTPDKSMRVFYKELEDLPKCSDLDETEYSKYIHAPEYAVEISYCGGIYTGQVKDNKPEGHGTILYFDHRFTGMFHDGEPVGKGVIYTRDGSEIPGEFSPVPTPSCETLVFTKLTYYRSIS